LFIDPAYAAQAALVRAAMNERLSFIHLFHTCLFEAHDSGNTCYDPLIFHYPDIDYVFNNTVASVIVADTIMVSPSYGNCSNSSESFDVYYPNDKNGSWVNLRNFSATIINPFMEGQILTAPVDNVDVALRPGKMIPWVSNAGAAYKTTQQVLESTELQLVINRDGRGHAAGSLYLGDGITQSQLDSKTYEYYKFNLGNKSLKKIVANDNRQNSNKKLQSVLITDAADLKNTDFACMTDENDLSITQLDIAYNSDLRILNISHATGIPLFNMKDIHFGKTGSDLNLCDLESHFYHLGSVHKQVDQWTV
jgi:alpha-glucosidase (family GH31 glycosyl hydrolase)